MALAKQESVNQHHHQQHNHNHSFLTNIPEEEMLQSNRQPSCDCQNKVPSSSGSDITYTHEDDDHLSIHFEADDEHHHHTDSDSPEYSVSRPNSSVYKRSELAQSPPLSPLPSPPASVHPQTAFSHSAHQTLLRMEDDFNDVHKQLTSEIELVFENIAYSLNSSSSSSEVNSSSNSNSCSNRQQNILNSISGHAAPGQVLAVMGASGSGKTTLLNVLSGRTKPTCGQITLNGARLNKQQRRRICYVLQQDIFFPNLTLKQTLMYTARLRLPQSMADSEKLRLVEKLIDELHLTQCQHTAIGDVSQRGLSGGEKKRVNIACELLTNPSVMLIDEPTSGLDSCTAHSLVASIKKFAVEKRKTVVMTVHQPSSQMFYMFDQLLLLANGGGSGGRVAYFGPISGVVPFFGGIGHSITVHYNPADYILEVVAAKSAAGGQALEDIVQAARGLPKSSRHHTEGGDEHCEEEWKKTASLKSIELADEVKFNINCNGGEHHHHHHHHHTHFDSDSGRSSWSEPDRSSEVSTLGNNSQSGSPQLPPKPPQSSVSLCQGGEEEMSIFGRKMAAQKEVKSAKKNKKSSKKLKKHSQAKWPTSMWTQVCILTERNFREAKSRMLSKLNWIQTVVLAILAGLIWFRPVRTEETMEDVRGWIFFTTTYWMLFGLFQALVSFPAEREVVAKERASGAYRLSAYYLAKMAGELPLTVALPSVFFLISYPMLSFSSSSLPSFLSCWLFLLLSTIVAQSVGLFIGAACADLELSVTSSALYSLSTMLLAGYYTAMPEWLAWARYLSIVYYAFLNMQMVHFGAADGGIQCSSTASKFAFCQAFYSNSSSVDSTSVLPPSIPYSELKLQLDLMNLGSEPTPLWFNTLVLIAFLVFFRSLGYLVLRYGRKATF